MAEEENQIEIKEEGADLASFDPSKKKKKKKVVIQDPADGSVEQLAEKTESLSVSESLEPTFTGLKKKKKKQVEAEPLEDDKENNGEDLDHPTGSDEQGEGIVLEEQMLPWEGTDRDYKYEELLSRVFHILRENNPELAGDRQRTVMRPPQVLREGTKKTVFVNFMDLCKSMHRQPDHVMTFLLAELGTSGSLDGQQRLVVKGRFAPKNFEGILRRYINEYVICYSCKRQDTILSKENRLFFLRCEKARPLFNDRRKFTSLVDPRLEGRYPMSGLYQALPVASMCIQEQAAARPLIGDVVTALSYLAIQGYDPTTAPANIVNRERPKAEIRNGRISRNEEGGGSGRSRWDLDGSEKEESPKETAKMLNKDLERERLVAKAKMWVEKRRQSA